MYIDIGAFSKEAEEKIIIKVNICIYKSEYVEKWECYITPEL